MTLPNNFMSIDPKWEIQRVNHPGLLDVNIVQGSTMTTTDEFSGVKLFVTRSTFFDKQFLFIITNGVSWYKLLLVLFGTMRGSGRKVVDLLED